MNVVKFDRYSVLLFIFINKIQRNYGCALKYQLVYVKNTLCNTFYICFMGLYRIIYKFVVTCDCIEALCRVTLCLSTVF